MLPHFMIKYSSTNISNYFCPIVDLSNYHYIQPEIAKAKAFK